MQTNPQKPERRDNPRPVKRRPNRRKVTLRDHRGPNPTHTLKRAA